MNGLSLANGLNESFRKGSAASAVAPQNPPFGYPRMNSTPEASHGEYACEASLIAALGRIRSQVYRRIPAYFARGPQERTTKAGEAFPIRHPLHDWRGCDHRNCDLSLQAQPEGVEAKSAVNAWRPAAPNCFYSFPRALREAAQPVWQGQRRWPRSDRSDGRVSETAQAAAEIMPT